MLLIYKPMVFNAPRFAFEFELAGLSLQPIPFGKVSPGEKDCIHAILENKCLSIRGSDIDWGISPKKLRSTEIFNQG
jgi:hypothetical protein